MRELAHGVGLTCGVMISCVTASLICTSISSFVSMGSLYLPCCTGRTLGSTLIEYFLGILPILSNESAKCASNQL